MTTTGSATKTKPVAKAPALSAKAKPKLPRVGDMVLYRPSTLSGLRPLPMLITDVHTDTVVSGLVHSVVASFDIIAPSNTRERAEQGDGENQWQFRPETEGK